VARLKEGGKKEMAYSRAFRAPFRRREREKDKETDERKTTFVTMKGEKYLGAFTEGTQRINWGKRDS